MASERHRAHELSGVAEAAAGSTEPDGDLGDERGRLESASDHEPGRRQLRAVFHAGQQADYFLVELQESAESQLRAVSGGCERRPPGRSNRSSRIRWFSDVQSGWKA